METARGKAAKNAGYWGKFYFEVESLKLMENKILSYVEFRDYKYMHLDIRYGTPSEMFQRFWMLYGFGRK